MVSDIDHHFWLIPGKGFTLLMRRYEQKANYFSSAWVSPLHPQALVLELLVTQVCLQQCKN